jgi:hypothetical protein
LLAVHEAANGDKLNPEKFDVEVDRSLPVRMPQLCHPLALDQKRYPPPLILHDLRKLALLGQKIGDQIHVTGKNLRLCHRLSARHGVFFYHLITPLSGLIERPPVEL